MKRIIYLMVMLSQTFIATSYSGPMESHKNYNVILVHGAGGSMYGLDCANDSKLDGAWTYLVPNEKPTNTEQENYLTLAGGYGEKLIGGARESCAQDMDLIDENKKDDSKYVGLQHWLVERVLLVVNFRLPVTS